MVENLAMDEIKTKTMATLLNAVGAKKALVVTSENDKNVYLSTRNIKGAKTAFVGMLNVYDILKYDTVVITKDAVAAIEEVYA